MIWVELHDSKLSVSISLDLVVQGFDFTDGTIVIGLVIFRITGLQNEGVDIFTPHNCDGAIIKMAIMSVIKRILWDCYSPTGRCLSNLLA